QPPSGPPGRRGEGADRAGAQGQHSAFVHAPSPRPRLASRASDARLVALTQTLQDSLFREGPNGPEEWRTPCEGCLGTRGKGGSPMAPGRSEPRQREPDRDVTGLLSRWGAGAD